MTRIYSFFLSRELLSRRDKNRISSEKFESPFDVWLDGVIDVHPAFVSGRNKGERSKRRQRRKALDPPDWGISFPEIHILGHFYHPSLSASNLLDERPT